MVERGALDLFNKQYNTKVEVRICEIGARGCVGSGISEDAACHAERGEKRPNYRCSAGGRDTS